MDFFINMLIQYIEALFDFVSFLLCMGLFRGGMNDPLAMGDNAIIVFQLELA